MDYKKTLLDSAISIDGIYTVHYFEYTKDFTYSGEIHDFWELVYADKQSILITAGAKEIVLPLGHLYLHKPNEFHNIRCDGKRSANSIIISFDCSCQKLMNIAGTVIAVNNNEKKILGSIIREAESVFSTPLGLAYTREMRKSSSVPFGGEQLIKLYLEQLLILLIRGNRSSTPTKTPKNNHLLISICDYLEKHVFDYLRFTDIKDNFNISDSVIKKVFHENMDCGVMEYFNRLKIDAAKEMIRNGEMNITEIADRLSFNTSQYFTTVFKRISGMTPTEYAYSVRSDIEVLQNSEE